MLNESGLMADPILRGNRPFHAREANFHAKSCNFQNHLAILFLHYFLLQQFFSSTFFLQFSN